MELKKIRYQLLKWITRIVATAIIVFGLQFYFGYGNPLPFINPEYSIYDNTWLTVFPIMFIGLAIGWKWPKVGGLLITIPILFGLILGVIVRGGMPTHMVIPFIVGVLYIVTGYAKVRE